MLNPIESPNCYYHYYACSECGREFGVEEPLDSTVFCRCQIPSLVSNYIYKKSSRNAQLSDKEKPVVWKHPVTGEIRYPGHTGDMPDYYKSQGYERKEFSSYQEHKKFCNDNGLVNHAVEGIRDEALDS